MTTYKEIQNTIKKRFGYTAKTCWIAHILSDHGKTRCQSANRINKNTRKYPCPLNKRADIEITLKELGKI